MHKCTVRLGKKVNLYILLHNDHRAHVHHSNRSVFDRIELWESVFLLQTTQVGWANNENCVCAVDWNNYLPCERSEFGSGCLCDRLCTILHLSHWVISDVGCELSVSRLLLEENKPVAKPHIMVKCSLF